MAFEQFASSWLARSCASFFLVGSLALLACGDDGKGSGADSAKPPELETKEGSWEGSLSLDPWPSEVGDNRLEIDLKDADGEPLEGATVEISPWMPAHGHGSTDVKASEGEPGHYVTDKLYLNMPGLWELRVHVTRDSDEGRLVASFEVP